MVKSKTNLISKSARSYFSMECDRSCTSPLLTALGNNFCKTCRLRWCCYNLPSVQSTANVFQIRFWSYFLSWSQSHAWFCSQNCFQSLSSLMWAYFRPESTQCISTAEESSSIKINTRHWWHHHFVSAVRCDYPSRQ